MLFFTVILPSNIILKTQFWTSNWKSTTLSYLFNNSTFLKLLNNQRKSFKGKIYIYVRKYGRFPLKDGKFNNFYKLWFLPGQIKGNNNHNSNQPTEGWRK